MSPADQLSYRPGTEMEDSFRREEMKGQRHDWRDDDVDAEFAL